MNLLYEDYDEKRLERRINMFEKETILGLVDIIDKMHKHSIEDYKNVISCEIDGDIIDEYKFEQVYSEQFHLMFHDIAHEFQNRLITLKSELIKKLDIKKRNTKKLQVIAEENESESESDNESNNQSIKKNTRIHGFKLQTH